LLYKQSYTPYISSMSKSERGVSCQSIPFQEFVRSNVKASRLSRALYALREVTSSAVAIVDRTRTVSFTFCQ